MTVYTNFHLDWERRFSELSYGFYLGKKFRQKMAIWVFLVYLGEIESDSQTAWTCICTILCHGQCFQFSTPNLQWSTRFDFKKPYSLFGWPSPCISYYTYIIYTAVTAVSGSKHLPAMNPGPIEERRAGIMYSYFTYNLRPFSFWRGHQCGVRKRYSQNRKFCIMPWYQECCIYGLVCAFDEEDVSRRWIVVWFSFAKTRQIKSEPSYGGKRCILDA